MPELEAVLVELGRSVEFPATPDLAGVVRDRLEARRARLRPLAIALAVVVVALGAALAVPSARTALLDLLGLHGVHVVRVDELPVVPANGELDLGRRVTLDEARRRAPWLLETDARPDRVYLDSSLPGAKVTFLWGTPSKPRLLLTEFNGRAYITKLIEPGTTVERVDVGDEGAWFEDPHVVAFRDRNGIFRESSARLAASTLLWQQGDVTLRLEGDLSKEDAVRIARSAG
jgi:hypothetical protein